MLYQKISIFHVGKGSYTGKRICFTGCKKYEGCVTALGGVGGSCCRWSSLRLRRPGAPAKPVLRLHSPNYPSALREVDPFRDSYFVGLKLHAGGQISSAGPFSATSTNNFRVGQGTTHSELRDQSCEGVPIGTKIRKG